MVVKKIKNPACILCPRNQPSLCGECFLAIPAQLNEDGLWKYTFHWFLFCGNCVQQLLKMIHITDKPIGEVDFMNLFLEKPITIFKEKGQLKKVEIGKYY